MRLTPSQKNINERKDIWKAVCWRMNERRIMPQELARMTGYSKNLIEKGICGDPVPVTEDFLQNCVTAFGLTNARAMYFEDTLDILSHDELVQLIKPPPAMPPRQGNFWDYND
jgi:hypothetical protein